MGVYRGSVGDLEEICKGTIGDLQVVSRECIGFIWDL